MPLSRRIFFSSLIILIQCLALATTPAAKAQDPSDPGCNSLLRGAALSPDLLAQEIRTQLTRVAEFEVLRQHCEKLGIRCWIFGGTAATFAHYVRWDFLYRQGDTRIQPHRLDYDFTNIFRSNQDIDVVIDGTDAQARDLENLLRHEIPAFQGHKSSLEVRPLRQARGNKEALLGNLDFLEQHTDSHSTGLIEIAPPPVGEAPILDLRDWNPARGYKPIFLKDVASAQLHYYYSYRHSQTSRARKGLNPPILSVIRYLTKAFQFELEIPPEDEKILRKLIEDFDPHRDLTQTYVQDWIERNGKKLFFNAVNVEYAWNKLEELGLRRRLIRLGQPGKIETLAWWLNREPLPTFPLGQGFGLTAKDLKISTITHETRSFATYEILTRSHTGRINALISRSKTPGEVAHHGDGFYTVSGPRGTRGTGFNIRMKLHPDARAGSDFKVVRPFSTPDWKTYVRVLNRAAIIWEPTSFDLQPLDFFRYLADSNRFDATQLGLIHQELRKLDRRMRGLSTQETQEIYLFLDGVLKRRRVNVYLCKAVAETPIFRQHPLLAPLIKGSFADHLLYTSIHHSNSDTQMAAAKVLAQLPIQEPRFAVAYAAVLHARCFSKIIYERFVLRELFVQNGNLSLEFQDALANASRSYADSRASITYILGRQRQISPATRNFLIQSIRIHIRGERLDALSVLRDAKIQDPELIRGLMGVLLDETSNPPEYRYAAAEILTEIGASFSDDLIQVFRQMRHHSDPEIARICLRGLVHAYHQTPRLDLLESITDFMEHPNASAGIYPILYLNRYRVVPAAHAPEMIRALDRFNQKHPNHFPNEVIQLRAVLRGIES